MEKMLSSLKKGKLVGTYKTNKLRALTFNYNAKQKNSTQTINLYFAVDKILWEAVTQKNQENLDN